MFGCSSRFKICTSDAIRPTLSDTSSGVAPNVAASREGSNSLTAHAVVSGCRALCARYTRPKAPCPKNSVRAYSRTVRARAAPPRVASISSNAAAAARTSSSPSERHARARALYGAMSCL